VCFIINTKPLFKKGIPKKPKATTHRVDLDPTLSKCMPIMGPTKAVQVMDMNIHLMMVMIGKVMVIHLIHTHATIEEK
jgi:hypothetical protein